MDAPSVETALPSVVSIAVALGTFYFVQRRADRTEQRMATRELVDMLLQQNKALLVETDDMRNRITALESTHSKCEQRIMELLGVIAHLKHDDLAPQGGV